MKAILRLLIVVTLAAGAIAVVHPKGRWRVRIVAQKTFGYLPGLPWSEVVAALGTRRWGLGDSKIADELFLGDVRVERFEADGGACPVAWSTPLGLVWGRRSDVGLLDAWFQAENRAVPRLSGAVADLDARDGLFALDMLQRGAQKVWIHPRDPASANCLVRTLEHEISAGNVQLVSELQLSELSGIELVRVSPGRALELYPSIEKLRTSGSAHLFIGDGFVPIQSVVAVEVEPGSPCPVLWRTLTGELWGRPNEADVLALIDGELLSSRVYVNDRVGIDPGDVVLDVGGHVGMFTLLSLSKGAARTVVFEPEPGNLACLEKTFADEIANGSVTLIDAAAWERLGTLKFELSAEALGHESSRGKVSDAGELTVRAETIDHVIEQLGLERVDYIKMDIEGAERHALAGARKTIERFGPQMALCVYHRPDDWEVVPRVVSQIRPSYRLARGTGPRLGQVYFF